MLRFNVTTFSWILQRCNLILHIIFVRKKNSISFCTNISIFLRSTCMSWLITHSLDYNKSFLKKDNLILKKFSTHASCCQKWVYGLSNRHAASCYPSNRPCFCANNIKFFYKKNTSILWCLMFLIQCSLAKTLRDYHPPVSYSWFGSNNFVPLSTTS